MITRRTVLAVLSAGAIAPPALSCSKSSGREDVRTQVLRAFKAASAVVLARVVDAGFQAPLADPLGESPTHNARLEVVEAWKGRHAPGSLVRTVASTNPGTCAPVLAPGETYLLYLRDKEPYDVSSSHRSAKLDDAAEDLAILRGQFVRP